MSSPLSSFNHIEESVKFMDWGFRAWRSQPLFAKGRKIAEAQVQLGDSATVGLVAPRNLAVTLPGTAGRDIKVRVVYQGPVKAPIKAGQHIADLVVSTPDTPPIDAAGAENAVDEAASSADRAARSLLG